MVVAKESKWRWSESQRGRGGEWLCLVMSRSFLFSQNPVHQNAPRNKEPFWWRWDWDVGRLGPLKCKNKVEEGDGEKRKGGVGWFENKPTVRALRFALMREGS